GAGPLLADAPGDRAALRCWRGGLTVGPHPLRGARARGGDPPRRGARAARARAAAVLDGRSARDLRSRAAGDGVRSSTWRLPPRSEAVERDAGDDAGRRRV